MSPAERSRRWERTGHMRYVPTPERNKRLAEVSIEEHDSSRGDPLPDLLPLPPDVPSSGQADIEDTAMPSHVNQSPVVGVNSSASSSDSLLKAQMFRFGFRIPKLA